MDLAITTTSADKRAVVVLRGSVDLANRDELTAAGRAALAGAHSALVIDLAGVTFMDSTGIGALVTLARDSEDAGVTFSLRAPSPQVTRILQISGLLNVWPTEQAYT